MPVILILISACIKYWSCGGIQRIWGRLTHIRNVCCFGIPYLLTAWCRVLFEKLTALQLVKKFPAFHGTRRFITALTSLRHLSVSWASPIQSIYPHPTSWRSILILSTHLRLGLPNGLFSSGFPTKTLYAPLSSPIRATCPANFILLALAYLPIDKVEESWLMNMENVLKNKKLTLFLDYFIEQLTKNQHILVVICNVSMHWHRAVRAVEGWNSTLNRITGNRRPAFILLVKRLMGEREFYLGCWSQRSLESLVKNEERLMCNNKREN